MITNSGQKQIQFFKCYQCLKYFEIVCNKKEKKTDFQASNQNKCKICFSEFIEEISQKDMFLQEKIYIPTYEIEKPKKQQEIQVIKRKVKFKNNDPFVRDILRPQFPQIFNKKKIDVQSQFQSIVGRMNIFELDLTKNGPTDPSFIKKLKKIKFSDLKSSNKSCSICTDVFLQQKKVIPLSCGHVFHKYCIVPWLELNNSCPVCRKNLPAKRIIQLQQI